jgi:hypothetical protein
LFLNFEDEPHVVFATFHWEPIYKYCETVSYNTTLTLSDYLVRSHALISTQLFHTKLTYVS